MKDYIERYEFQNLSKIREIVLDLDYNSVIPTIIFLFLTIFFFNKKYVSRENVS